MGYFVLSSSEETRRLLRFACKNGCILKKCVMLPFFVVLILAPSCLGQGREQKLAVLEACCAVAPDIRGGNVEYLYDHGKFAIIKSYEQRLYNGSHPPMKWTIDMRTRIAYIDAFVALRRLNSDIESQGLDKVARTTGVPRDKLVRFRHIFPQMAERDLDHLLYKPSPDELSKYRNVGKEVVCGRSCVVYSRKQRSTDKMRVDTDTGFVFKRHYLETPPNPRISPKIRDWQLMSFHIAHRLDSSRFILPPGITAELPRILSDLTLPQGVRKTLMSGQDYMLGIRLP